MAINQNKLAANYRLDNQQIEFKVYSANATRIELSHDHLTPQWNDGTIYASGSNYRNVDSGLHAPKGVLLSADNQSIGIKPTRALKDDVIYEVNVRGLTKNDLTIPAQYRGT